MRWAGAAAALLAAVLPGTARGYVRTTDACTAVCLYWPSRTVTWVLNEQGSWSAPTCAANAALAAAQASFAEWSQGCTDLRLVYGGTTPEIRVGYDRGGANENLVVFRHGPCEQHVDASDPCWKNHSCGSAHDCWEGGPEVIAYTTVTYSQRTGEILDADVEVDDWGGDPSALPAAPGGQTAVPDGYYFTCTPPPGGSSVPSLCAAYGDSGCAYMDAQNTVTHEVGHFIGLDHTPRNAICAAPGDPSLPCADTTMYPDARPREISKRILSADDVAGLCAIYPAGGPPATCRATNIEKCLGGCGCGAAGPAGLLALLGVVAAAPRRRLRGAARRRGFEGAGARGTAPQGQRTTTPA